MHKKLLWGLFSLFFGLSLILTVQKFVLDNHKDYAFTVDYNSILSLHKYSGLPESDIKDTFKKFKKHHISTITLSNNNLFSLEDRGILDTFSGVYLLGQTNDKQFKTQYSYVQIFGQNKDLEKVIEKRFKNYKTEKVLYQGKHYIGINLNYNKMIYAALPFLDSDVKFLSDLGFNIVFKIDNKFDDTYQVVIDDINHYKKQYSNTHFYIEPTENGYLTFNYEKNISPSILPNVPYLYKEYFSSDEKQIGIDKLAKEKDIIRYHLVGTTTYSSNYKDLDVLVDRVYLAVAERNIDMVGFQLPNSLDNRNATQITNNFFGFVDKIHNTLSNSGYTTSNNLLPINKPILSDTYNVMLIWVSYLAATAFLLIFLSEYFKTNLLFNAFVLTLVSFIYFGQSIVLFGFSLKILAILFVVAVPVFAYIKLFQLISKKEGEMTIFDSVKYYLFINVFVAVLAFLIPSLHFSEFYFKYVFKFDGISITTTLPLLILFLIAILSFMNLNIKQSFKLLKKPIVVYQLIILVVLGGLFLFYLSRTGNSGSLLPFEEQFRQFMTDFFGVRPRTKEFLIGQPILLLLIFYFKRYNFAKLLLPFAALAQISMLNTFCHLHTPIDISFVRSCLGILLGLIIGFVLLFISQLVEKYFKKIEKKKIE